MNVANNKYYFKISFDYGFLYFSFICQFLFCIFDAMVLNKYLELWCPYHKFNFYYYIMTFFSPIIVLDLKSILSNSHIISLFLCVANIYFVFILSYLTFNYLCLYVLILINSIMFEASLAIFVFYLVNLVHLQLLLKNREKQSPVSTGRPRNKR